MIRGNVIWNGPAHHSLGLEDEALAAEVRAGNAAVVAFVPPATGGIRILPRRR